MTDLHPAVKALVQGPNYGHLATLLPDGSPHSVPLWIDMEGDRVAFLTGPGPARPATSSASPGWPSRSPTGSSPSPWP